MKRLIYWFVNFAIRVYTQITCRIDAPDLHQMPLRGPLIVVANHTGQIEVPMLFSHLQPRKLTGWAKAEAWDNWFLRWIFGLWGAIPVRGEVDMNALKEALRKLEKGYIFGLAPEGTRNKNGKLKRGLPGAVIVALHSGAPIVALAHWGGENYLSNLKRLKRTDFHIRLGKPFKINIAGVKVTGEVRQQIVDEMMCQLAILMPEEYRGEYAEMSKSPPRFIKAENIT